MIWFYAGFTVLILALLALDLGVFHREPREVKIEEALGWSAAWIVLGLGFAGFIYQAYEGHWRGIGLGGDLMSVSSADVAGRVDGGAAAFKYLTGYLIEKSLSVDNIFVIAMIFGLLEIPAAYRRRILFFGILGAIAARAAMIALGIRLLADFSWIIYVFGVVLILIALKMLFVGQDGGRSGGAFIRAVRRRLPVAERVHGGRFWVRAGGSAKADAILDAASPGALLMTPLFFALLAVESADLVFSIESIPAVLAVTTDPFLVFTSNVFAILGMRSLYFALEGMIDVFHHLKTALALV
ncbi:MAG: TerC/Alx family metal homeostasis membrane protein [Elusimicrobia bacterium]|nr:TerC/Alx family metal homeostasis membrane protein [Elusimicrobiota bacterium]